MVVTIKQQIISMLRVNGGWVSGMEIESKAYEWKSKRIGRTLREMSSGNNPSLEKIYTNDKHHAVQYRISKPQMSTDRANEFLKSLSNQERLI